MLSVAAKIEWNFCARTELRMKIFTRKQKQIYIRHKCSYSDVCCMFAQRDKAFLRMAFGQGRTGYQLRLYCLLLKMLRFANCRYDDRCLKMRILIATDSYACSIMNGQRFILILCVDYIVRNNETNRRTIIRKTAKQKKEKENKTK